MAESNSSQACEAHAANVPHGSTQVDAENRPRTEGSSAIGDVVARSAVLQRLTAQDWADIIDVLPKMTAARARKTDKTRLFIEATLWVADTGLGWRLLPASYGSWRGNYMRFVRWMQCGVWFDIISVLGLSGPRELLIHIVGDYLEGQNMKEIRDRFEDEHRRPEWKPK